MSEFTLNKEQRQAVCYKNGPLLIIAGAGTGKTTVITERVKYLITKKLAEPGEILALTFTEKAANEMQERVDVGLPLGYTQMWISTFHSFCDQILRDEALQIGLNPEFNLLTTAEAVQLVRDNIFIFKLKYYKAHGKPDKFVDGLLQHFSRLQDENILPSDYKKRVEKQHRSFGFAQAIGSEAQARRDDKSDDEILSDLIKYIELARAYEVYSRLKVKNGYMDFGDLIVNTIALFKKRKAVLKKYQHKFKYILVDEFQDTNFAQSELVNLLARRYQNITAVADDDQAIYRWRGAALDNALRFKKNFPKAKIISLTKNYRTGQYILDKAYDLINHNNPDRLEVKEGIDKRLVSMVNTNPRSPILRLGKGEIEFIHTKTSDQETQRVAAEIKKLTKGNFEYQDIAILVRANNHATSFINAFEREGIPFQFLGPGSLFDKQEVKELTSYLKILYNPDDTMNLYQVLSMQHLDISGRVLVRLLNFSKRKNQSLYETLSDLSKKEVDDSLEKIVDKKTKSKLNEFKSLFNRHLDESKKRRAVELLFDFIKMTGLYEILLNPETEKSQHQAINTSKLFEKLKAYEDEREIADIHSVVDWIDLSSEYKDRAGLTEEEVGQINAVKIMTIHSAKGLEFPVVFLPNLVSERFPSRNRPDPIPVPEKLLKENFPSGDYHLQEERRLFYVGMTRAMQKLYLTAADFYAGGVRRKKLSPFIFEALGDAVASAEQPTINNQHPTIFKEEISSDHTSSTTPHPPIHVDFLSYSQIKTFETCPLHYKLEYILRIPKAPNAYLSYGVSMHDALEKLLKIGKKPTKPIIEKSLRSSWRVEGYDSKTHEITEFKRGVEQLFGFVNISFPNPKKVLSLESKFTTYLNTNKKGDRGVKIGGKIDRVDKTPDGIEIIDYKTSENVPDQKSVDKDLQLSFYALAISKIKEAPFDVPLDKIKLSLYYFENQQKITTTRTIKQLEEVEKHVFEVKHQIEISDFLCSGNYLCKQCEYKSLCGFESGE